MPVLWLSPSLKTPKVDVLTVLVSLVDLMVLVEVVELAPADKNATEANVSVIEAAQASNVDLIDVVPLVEIVLLDKLVCQESAQELVHPNVSDLTEQSELVDGTDAEVAVDLALLGTDAETEPASAIPTARTNTAVMMVVEELVELVKEEPSAKEPLIPILNNATSTATLKSELKSENSRLMFLSERLAELMSLDL